MDHCRTLPSNSQLDLPVGSVPGQDANLVGLISESWQGSGRQQDRGMMLQTDRQRFGYGWVDIWYRTRPGLVTWRVLIAIQTAARNKERVQQSRA